MSVPGHSVRFSHDIFFEWAFFHVLSDRGDDGSTKSEPVVNRPRLRVSSS